MTRQMDQSLAPAQELTLSSAEFSKIAQILNEVSGITLPQSKESLVYSRLAKRLRQLKLPSFKSYCDLIASPSGADERFELLSALTTNVTRFFREPHHFTDLDENVLKPFAMKGGRPRLRIWSSACSSGEEPYSIAMTVLDRIPRAVDMDLKILATDIDPKILSMAARGVYSDGTVDPLTSAQRGKYLTGSSGQWQVSESVKRIIRFAGINLTQRFPMAGKFDAIFCRNVAIYFDKTAQDALWFRLVQQLAPGGRLYIGHSERVAGPAVDLLDLVGVTSYRLKSQPSQNGRN
jgi:chemotaxis protein methyltransferase CheR